VATGHGLCYKDEDDEASNYFVDILPRIKCSYPKELMLYECIQEAGDTIFVPSKYTYIVDGRKGSHDVFVLFL